MIYGCPVVKDRRPCSSTFKDIEALFKHLNAGYHGDAYILNKKHTLVPVHEFIMGEFVFDSQSLNKYVCVFSPACGGASHSLKGLRTHQIIKHKSEM